MENTLDMVEKDISKGIAELTLLKKSAVVPPGL
jgi:hypothetical protein